MKAGLSGAEKPNDCVFGKENTVQSHIPGSSTLNLENDRAGVPKYKMLITLDIYIFDTR